MALRQLWPQVILSGGGGMRFLHDGCSATVKQSYPATELTVNDQYRLILTLPIGI